MALKWWKVPRSATVWRGEVRKDMLSGEYEHSIDQKGRIIMPSRLREELGDVFYVTEGLDGCLAVYSNEGFERMVQSLAAQPSNREVIRRIQRQILSSAVPCETDKQGRFVIPPKLRERAHLEKDVVVIGNINKVEIWDSAAWTSYNNSEEKITIEQAIEGLDDFII